MATNQAELTITDLGTSGEGIGKHNGLTVFVPGALPGDRVSVELTESKARYTHGRILRTLSAAPARVKAPCPLVGRCGGCQIQELDYAAQLKWKTQKVRDTFKHLAKMDVVVQETIGMDDPFHYRNKAQFPVGYGNGKTHTGFYAIGSHQIVDTEHCPIQHPSINDVLKKLRAFLKSEQISIYNEQTRKGLLRHLVIRVAFATGQIMVCVVLNGPRLPQAAKLVTALKDIPNMTSIVSNINTLSGNVILGKETFVLWGKPYILDKLGELEFEISAQSFFQVNPYQAEILYRKALALADLQGREQVWDLFCGTGTIALYIAKYCHKVFGVDNVAPAIADAKANARRNRIHNAEFMVGNAEFLLPKLRSQNRIKADVMILDPPRKGCDPAVLRSIVSIQPQRLVYISCDPATLVRDVKYLVEHGYQLMEVQPVDMFPHTIHVETVSLLTLK